MTRQAWIATTNATAVAHYLPSNYRIVGPMTDPDPTSDREGLLIKGTDNSGWTLDGYVLPRLASGLYFGKELTT